MSKKMVSLPLKKGLRQVPPLLPKKEKIMPPPLPNKIDLYEKVMIVNTFKVSNLVNSLVGNKKIYTICLSYDMLDEFIDLFSSVDFYNNEKIIINIDFYDERIYITKEELLKIEEFMKFIKNDFFVVLGNFNLNLSDNMIGKYNQILNDIFLLERKRPRFRYKLSIDRHPVNCCDRDDFCMFKCLGYVDFSICQLMMISTDDLDYLHKNNYISDRYYRDAIELKKIIYEFDKYLMDNFDIDNMSEFHKVMVVYNYMKDNIKYAYEATMMIDGVQTINPQSDAANWVFDPYDTYVNSRGVCSGQSRLMSILLNHSLLKMDSYVLTGVHQDCLHAWVGVVIDKKLYQCCITMRKPLLPLNMLGYKLDTNIKISKVYPLGYLTTNQVNSINNDLEIGGKYRKKNSLIKTLDRDNI